MAAGVLNKPARRKHIYHKGILDELNVTSYFNSHNNNIFVTRIIRLIHDAGKYMPISIYLPHKFTHKNGGNLGTRPGWCQVGQIDRY